MPGPLAIRHYTRLSTDFDTGDQDGRGGPSIPQRKQSFSGARTRPRADTAGATIVEGNEAGAGADIGATSKALILLVGHVGGVFCLIAILVLLVVPRLRWIDASWTVYFRGALTTLTGLTGSVSCHKVTATVAVSSLPTLPPVATSSHPPNVGVSRYDAARSKYEGTTRRPTTMTTAPAVSDLKIQSALSSHSFTAFPSPSSAAGEGGGGRDLAYYLLGYTEIICSAAAVFLATLTFTDPTTPQDWDARGARVEWKDAYGFGLLAICTAWILALALHAYVVVRFRHTLAFLHDQTRQATRASVDMLTSMAGPSTPW
ncbi:uncharacterized protein PFL1_02878 [Pseudozyma flocculosa PF-1]|uniref:Uncharacterized protein n=2 Tax=Pseudozyma flocculosa TaxID=84751 RepID=A0A5C3F2U5_9BASI|nr:uncharacterized protein PFL1_02878 [Pseudozyma flocculosa PF-1]EPQ29658.1 hypothetical protein PFL1_02878 [Pseudozyma flocculosa PF-1]SPO38226.1 uncharacterized protein PSFLO_03703 [Pseudozyma flocculosa]